MIKLLTEVKKTDENLVGGKAASLGEMLGADIPVPLGFVITPDSFDEMGDITNEMASKVLDVFNDLHLTRVAVRSSAIGEDGTDASWAGQMETFLNIKEDSLIDHIKKCWLSTRSERVAAYSKSRQLENNPSMAVIIQAMIDSDISGVMFTANPITKALDQIMIESCLGLGELLVSGEITPENTIINKDSYKLLVSIPSSQTEMMVYDNGNKLEKVPLDKLGKTILKPGILRELAMMGKRIENHYGSPQDIEWAIQDNNLYIIQSRPITTLNLG